MDYDGLRMFLELSRSLHFLRASRACHVSPSTLSRAVQRLEQETGSVLLERDRRSVRLTAEGGALRRARARDAGALAAAAARSARPPRQAVGQHRDLRVGHRLPELPPRAAGRLPRAPPRRPHPARDRLRGRRARTAGRRAASTSAWRRFRPSFPRGLVSRVLLYTPLVFAAPRVACEVERLCHQRPLPWASLPVVLPASGHARESADRWFRRRRIVAARLRRGARAARRSSRSSAWAAASASCRASWSTRARCAASSTCSTPTTAAPRWANSASASARSARSSPRRWCARCGIRSPPAPARPISLT